MNNAGRYALTSGCASLMSSSLMIALPVDNFRFMAAVIVASFVGVLCGAVVSDPR